MYVYRSTACLYSRWLHGHRTRTKGYISKMSFSKRHISLLIHLLFELWTGSIKSYVWSKINIKCASLFHAVNKGPRRTNKKRWGWVVASGKRESKTEIWWGSRLASQGYPPPRGPGVTFPGRQPGLDLPQGQEGSCHHADLSLLLALETCVVLQGYWKVVSFHFL